MTCNKCNAELDADAKFCTQCGSVASTDTESGSVDRYFANKENTCQVCGRVAPEVKYVELYQNIGMLITRHQKSIQGKLCKQCISEYFWKFTGITIFFGWWGVFSFFATIFFLLNNIGRYLFSLSMESIDV